MSNRSLDTLCRGLSYINGQCRVKSEEEVDKALPVSRLNMQLIIYACMGKISRCMKSISPYIMY